MSRVRELAKEIARNAVQAKPGGSPTISDLYLFFLRCFDNEAQAAEGALAEYLEGNVPAAVRICIQQVRKRRPIIKQATHSRKR